MKGWDPEGQTGPLESRIFKALPYSVNFVCEHEEEVVLG